MPGGSNLRKIVRGAVTSLHPDLEAILYRCAGQETGTGGKVLPRYAEGVAVRVQRQSESPTTLFHADRVGMENETRRFYINSAQGQDEKVASIVRPLARGGDMFQLVDDGDWWLVDAVIEDFTASGWVCVRATLQVNPPDCSNSDW